MLFAFVAYRLACHRLRLRQTLVDIGAILLPIAILLLLFIWLVGFQNCRSFFQWVFAMPFYELTHNDPYYHLPPSAFDWHLVAPAYGWVGLLTILLLTDRALFSSEPTAFLAILYALSLFLSAIPR